MRLLSRDTYLVVTGDVKLGLLFQCDEDEALVCPTAPPIEVEGGPLAGRILVLILESIGAEGFIGFFGGLFLFLGFMKLSCGGIICCRKTKAQEYADRMKEKGAPPKGRVHIRTTHLHIHTHTYVHTCTQLLLLSPVHLIVDHSRYPNC